MALLTTTATNNIRTTDILSNHSLLADYVAATSPCPSSFAKPKRLGASEKISPATQNTVAKVTACPLCTICNCSWQGVIMSQTIATSETICASAVGARQSFRRRRHQPREGVRDLLPARQLRYSGPYFHKSRRRDPRVPHWQRLGALSSRHRRQGNAVLLSVSPHSYKYFEFAIPTASEQRRSVRKAQRRAGRTCTRGRLQL